MSFLTKVSRFAGSPQGKKVFAEAEKLAKGPERRKQLEDARRRLIKKPTS